jgi:uncharacterized protein (DUF58 family)
VTQSRWSARTFNAAGRRNRRLTTFAEADHEDLSQGATEANAEGQASLLNHRWVWMGLIVFVVGVLTQRSALLAIAGFMLVAVAFGWAWDRFVIGGIFYQRAFHHRRAFPGETVEAQVTVENRKLLPLTWLQVEDEWPSAFGPADESILAAGVGDGLGFLVNVYSLRWYERVKRRYLLMARTRGIYEVGPAHLISGDPFSLFERGTQIEHQDLLIVYPAVKPLDQLGLMVNDPFGDHGVPQRLFEDPMRVIGVRDYQSGDGFRRVHWKATARTGTLQVKQYEPTRALSLSLCLNIAAFEQHWTGTYPELIEHLISVAASIATWALERGYAVGVTANAPLAQADQPLRAQPSRNRDQLRHVLETMAGISYFVTQEFGKFLVAESPRLPWGTTLALVTGYINEPILNAIGQVRAGGRRVALISVGAKPPPEIYGVPTYHLPLPETNREHSNGAARPIRLSET